MDDAALLQAFVEQKSQAAFRTLVDRHVGMVYGVCMRKLRDPHWAEDVSQAVFILLSQKAPSFKPGVVLGGWLYRTAVFACSNARDLKRTRDFHENRVLTMNDAQLDRDPPDPLLQAEMEGLLDEGLMTLSPAQRETLILRFFQNHSIADVAKARNTTLYATEKDLAAGIAQLRRFLSQRGVSASVGIVAAVLAHQASAHAVPATLAASCSAAALGWGGAAAVSTQVAELVAHLLKHTFPTRLLAALAGAVGCLLVATVVLAVANPFARHAPADVAGGTSVAAPQPLRAATPAEQVDLWATLRRAEIALRTMDTDALARDVAFTNLHDARDWDAMARVFAADLALKQAAAARFGSAMPSAGGELTAFRTFDQQLDALLPAIDRASADLRVAGDRAVLRFAYLPGRAAAAASRGGAVYFLREADGSGRWRIDAGASLEIVLEGLDGQGTRQAVDRLDDLHQALVYNHLSRLESTLVSLRSRVDRGEFARPEELREALQLAAQQYSGDNSGGQGVSGNVGSSRAFFHLALRRDRPEEARL